VTGFERLLSPIKVGALEIRNRVVTTATSASEAWRNPLLSGQPYVEFARARAAGGLGLFIAHPCYVNPFGELPPSIGERHAALADAVHAGGARVIVQLMHFGAVFRTDNDVRRPALWGFDHTVSPEGEAVHKMTGSEIEQVIEAYRRAARMVADAGCDGVELHGGHGYLVQQSLTPWTNCRDDEWGAQPMAGSAGGDRTLFARRLLDVLREEIGPDRILGYRTPTDDLRSPEDGGLGLSGISAAVQRLLDIGQIDLLNTTVGVGGASYARAIPNYRSTEAPNIPLLHRLRDRLHTDVPMIGTGRIASPGAAEALLERGECELVAMTRAHFAEPSLVAKLTSGRAHRIRPCVGGNVCVNSKLGGSPESTCFHNPEVLRETELRVIPAATPRRVLVIGAGPAGLKAAEVAARRGHQVRIVDAARRPGGRLRWVERTAAAALAGSLDHLVSELAEHGVHMEPGVHADESLLVETAPEFVVLATGATFLPPFPGALSTAQALAADAVADPVLLYDALGTNEPALVAEALARWGHQVTFVSRYETVMPFGGVLHRVEAPGAWHRLMSRIIVGGLLGDLTDGCTGTTATIVRSDGETIAELPCGTLVAAVAPRPCVELLPVLERLGIPYALAGDALAPRTAFNAFHEGHQVALTI
jgi:2,4-dienoyl-CoA reductase-like NADH-dependent reductase (Old Yellow Enzyme family)